ncbi:phosphoesterase family protein, partial [Acidithiobacillus sp. GGI-221]
QALGAGSAAGLACHPLSALSKGHFSLDHAPVSDVDSMQAAYSVSRPSGAVLGYYTRQDVPFYHALADHYVLFDHFHQAMFGGSTGNALFLAAARTCQDPKTPREWRVPKDMSYVDLPYDQAGYLINNLPPLQGPTDEGGGFLGPCSPAGAGLLWPQRPRPRPTRERVDASRLCGPPHRRHHQYPPAHRNPLPASAPERTGRCSLCPDGWTGFQRESARPSVYLIGDDP